MSLSNLILDNHSYVCMYVFVCCLGLLLLYLLDIHSYVCLYVCVCLDAWACSCCTYLNKENRQKCDICNTLRYPLGSHSHREHAIAPDVHVCHEEIFDSPWSQRPLQQQQQQPPAMFMELVSRSDTSGRRKVDRTMSDATIG